MFLGYIVAQQPLLPQSVTYEKKRPMWTFQMNVGARYAAATHHTESETGLKNKEAVFFAQKELTANGSFTQETGSMEANKGPFSPPKRINYQNVWKYNLYFLK